MISNICWWRKTGQNAWKWSILLREKSASSSTVNGQWLTNQSLVSAASILPRVSALLSQHILGSSWKVWFAMGSCNPRKSTRCWVSDALARSCHSSAAPVSSLAREVSFSEHAWTPVKTLLQECDGGLRYGAARCASSHPWSTNPGAVPACGYKLTEQCPCQNFGWKLTVGMRMRVGRAGENELSFEVIMAKAISTVSFLHALATLPSAGTSLMDGACKHHTASCTKLPNGLTSSTLHTASFPSAVRPDVQGILLLFWLASVFSSIVYRNGVFIMNSIILVMK